MNNLGVYFITDRSLSKIPVIETVKQALKGGAKIIQYREKRLTKEEKLKEAKKIIKLTKGKAIFIVNDDLEIAKEVNADGIHIGQDQNLENARAFLGDKIIGVTVHNLKEAKDAENLGANYIALSPIFNTDTKKDAGKPAGIKLIEEIKSQVQIPIVAIGGINENNINQVIDAGVRNIAMISAIVSKDDIADEVRKFNERILKN